MSKLLALFHTSQMHIRRFETLRDELAPELELRHVVREDLLQRAMDQGRLDDDIADDAMHAMQQAAKQCDGLLCTCSTLGPAADKLAQTSTVPIIRVDRAMAQKAVSIGIRIGVCAALHSTLGPTIELITATALAQNKIVAIRSYLMEPAWAKFLDSDEAGYARELETGVRQACAHADIVVLAQASMDCVLPLVEDLQQLVLSSPRIGMQAALARIA